MAFKSKYEEVIAGLLGKIKGLNWAYESIKLKYLDEKTYTPDFLLDGPGGKIYIESKGYFSPADRRKMILVRDQHPELDIRLLFQNCNVKLNKKSRTSYAEWAMNNNFIFAQGPEIPLHWIREARSKRVSQKE